VDRRRQAAEQADPLLVTAVVLVIISWSDALLRHLNVTALGVLRRSVIHEY
jgi:hypothetical protein